MSTEIDCLDDIQLAKHSFDYLTDTENSINLNASSKNTSQTMLFSDIESESSIDINHSLECDTSHDKKWNIPSENQRNSEREIVKKRKPLNVLRRTQMSLLIKDIDMNLHFMLLGDIFIHQGIFTDSRDGKMSNVCPVESYRPVMYTEKTEKYCIAYVENSSAGIVDLSFPIHILERLNCLKAKTVADKMNQLVQFYVSVNALMQKVNIYYHNDKNFIEYMLQENHVKSLQIAKNYLKRITQEKIIMFHYKKIDPQTLTHKLHFSGSNKTMTELFTGHSDLNEMEKYMNRIGTPKYMDAEGIVNLTLAKFSGQNVFNLNLITLDDLIIPLTCTIKRIFLNEFEILPGEIMSEYLDIHVLDTNLNIISDVLAKRKQNVLLSCASQMEYEMQAEMFVQKFYDDEMRKIPQN